MGLPLLLGFGEGGYFIPYRLAGASPAPSRYPVIEELLLGAETQMRARLTEIEALAESLSAIPWEAEAPEPRWNQDWFPWLDAALAYAMARAMKPRIWLEIGSGHSTRFVARAIKDGALETRLIAIDPAPRAALAGLKVEWIGATLQEAGLDRFGVLRAGDVLFVDSSHILMPGSDVDLLLNSIVPSLPSGVLLHVHDIFLPDSYPRDWAWRGYNEQIAVASLFLSGAWEILASSRYLSTRLESQTRAGILGRLPQSPGPVSSLWLRKR
jgi:predicted O-methyltransferase YrrM